jgi:DNA-binding NarL/FixJ family response regulator
VTIKKHLFISTNAELLPRWKLAFPRATGIKTGAMPKKKQVDFVWLRLQNSSNGTPVDQQIKAVRDHIGTAALLVLSDIPNDDEAMQAFSHSARGYCNSHAAAEVLQQVASVVEQGGLWIGESLMSRLLVGINQVQSSAKQTDPDHSANSVNSAKPDWQDKLTERELEVALAIATGASNKEVARQLAITERTVKAHVSGVFIKLNVQDRLQLALKVRGIEQ